MINTFATIVILFALFAHVHPVFRRNHFNKRFWNWLIVFVVIWSLTLLDPRDLISRSQY